MKDFYFTFGTGQKHFPGHVKISAYTSETARSLMFANYSNQWSLQYDSLEALHEGDRRQVDHIKEVRPQDRNRS